MKALWIPAAVLALLLAVTLAVGGALGRRCDDWAAMLAPVETMALRGDWDGAEAAMEALRTSWQERQRALHTVLEHDVLEEADTLVNQCVVLCREKDTAALCVAVSQLRDQFTLLKEMQRFSIENVL